MMRWLEWLAVLPLAMWQQAAPPAALALAGMAGMAWLLLPRGTPARGAGLLAALPMLFWMPPRPAPGEFDATVLDVGNGLAVHVQTATHDLVYDTGPAYGPDSDASERVVLPYLAAAGVHRLDRVVISHDDDDHSGGAASLLAGIPVAEVVSGLAPAHPLLARGGGARPCVAGTRWRWDGVDFEILHPGAGDPPYRRDNDTSCVLRIAAPGGSLLLAGDIEAGAERRLVVRYGDALASSVVVVPHHGSRSSSTPALVQAADAETAIFTVGYLNAFRHPHPTVWERWAAAGARNWRTDSQGAIHITVRGAGGGVVAERTRQARYWHGR
jgi:competence protein ComEC